MNFLKALSQKIGDGEGGTDAAQGPLCLLLFVLTPIAMLMALSHMLKMASSRPLCIFAHALPTVLSKENRMKTIVFHS
jgi:hypothetical protein